MSEDLRFRLKQKPNSTQNKREPKKPETSSGSIFGIWDEQRRMQAEEDKMAKELAETKKKAKELSRTLRKHRYGEVKQESFTKLRSIPTNFVDILSNALRGIISWVNTHRKLSFGLASAVVFVFVGSLGYSALKPDPTGTLGDSTSSLPIADDLTREKPKFPILYPSSKSPDDFDVVRISPEGADVSYTFLDRFTEDGQIFKVTQQEIPKNFDIEKIATDFQATNIIQIDDDKVYHGYSEKGGIQSLIFTKNDRLITIRSPEKFTDDQWAGYIISLQ